MKKIIQPEKVWLTVVPPPSKSIAIRAVAAGILALFSNKNDKNNQIAIHNFSNCDDAKITIEIAKSLGFDVSFSHSNSLTVSANRHCEQLFSSSLRATERSVAIHTEKEIATPAARNDSKNPNARNDGSIVVSSKESALCFRMFPFILSHFDREILLVPESSLKKRNHEKLFDFLKLFGINNQQNNDEIIIKNKIKAGNYKIDCSHSSQELTGLLFALPLCNEDSTVEVSNFNSVGYIDLTLEILEKFGIEITVVENENSTKIFFVKKNQKFKITDFTVESDWSAAANFLVLGAIAGEVTVANLNTNSLQPDRKMLSLFQDLQINCNEIAPSILKISKSNFSGFEFDATHCPDLIPSLTVLAFNAKTNSKIQGIDRLINKESNRKDVLLKVFSLLGGKIKIVGDSFEIFPSRISGGFADSHGDHRIAMAVAIAAKNAKNPTTVTGAECVNKSFPEFWKYF